MSGAYYNESDPFPAQWLRNLISAGHIAPGDVDERSIVDVRPDDLRDYTQCHFFAGIGGWSRALRLAGWDDARPVWTGSCPCQPFSAAGKRKGEADERHLWPEFRRLIAECRPSVIFGEQVASADGRTWLGGKPGLQRVQDQKAIVGVLSGLDLIGRLPHAVQTMLSGGGEPTQGQNSQGEEKRGSSEMEKAIARCRLDPSGGVSSQGEGPALYARPCGDPGCDRCGRMSNDRRAVQSRRRQDVGQPIVGQDQQRARLHAGEHAGRSLLHQRDGEHMGREQDRGDCRSDNVAPPQPVGGTANELGGRIKAAVEFSELAGVRADLEALGYAVGAADLCAASIGAPHIRQRLWWVAGADGRLAGNGHLQPGRQHGQQPQDGGAVERMADPDQGQRGWIADSEGRQRDGQAAGRVEGNGIAQSGGTACGLEHTASDGRQQRRAESSGRSVVGGCGSSGLGNANEPRLEGWGGGFDQHPDQRTAWSSGVFIPCADGKARRIEPGIFPLVDGLPLALDGLGPVSRVGALRGAGNAIVPQVAAEFIAAFMECAP